MNSDLPATLGVAACLLVLLALAAPYALLSDPGTGLPLYYGSGTVGAGAVVFFALLEVVVFLSGTRGRAAPDLAAGIAVVVGLAAVVVAALWALAVDQELIFSFTAAWMGWHRWAVLSLTLLLPGTAAVYARETLSA